MNRYEGMFLFDNATAQGWQPIEEEVRRLLDRIGAKLEVCTKYDERKLAYEIKRRKRGTYVLTYFEAAPDKITQLERDAGLSELLLRTMIMRADSITPERLAELKAKPVETSLQPAATEGRRGDYDGRSRGDRYGGRSDRDRPPRRREESDAQPAESAGAATAGADANSATSATSASSASVAEGTEPAASPEPASSAPVIESTEPTAEPGPAPQAAE